MLITEPQTPKHFTFPNDSLAKKIHFWIVMYSVWKKNQIDLVQGDKKKINEILSLPSNDGPLSPFCRGLTKSSDSSAN